MEKASSSAPISNGTENGENGTLIGGESGDKSPQALTMPNAQQKEVERALNIEFFQMFNNIDKSMSC